MGPAFVFSPGAGAFGSSVPALDALRRAGLRLMVQFGWTGTALLAVTAMMRGFLPGFWAVAIAGLLMIGPTLAMARREDHLASRLWATVSACAMPALFLFVLQGHAWQMDMHMAFFVAMAALALLCDWRLYPVAALVITAHHLIVIQVAPAWLFTGTAGHDRVLMHGLLVLLQATALGYLTKRLHDLIVDQHAAQSRHAAQAVEADRLRAEAENALAALTQAEQAAAVARAAEDALRQREQAGRRDDLLRVAGSFEQSVAGIVVSVSTSAEQLEGSARYLSSIARDTSTQAGAVAAAATQTSDNARDMAAAVASLSESISDIARAVEQQAALSDMVRAGSVASNEAVRSLSTEAEDIGGFVGMIDQIASRTDLLALNATIEAARAGDSGKGFAVVAGEVKSLANQSAEATAAIGGLLAAVNARAGSAEGALRDVGTAIGELNDAAGVIVGAVAEQRRVSATLGDRARDGAAGADEMAMRVGRVASTANAAGTLSQQVQDAAVHLSANAAELKTATHEFVAQLRAA